MKSGSHVSQVRIISGKFRGRKIEFVSIPGLRPTPDRLRETLFNWLQPNIMHLQCLDAYAGSGALGVESLSRGAKQVTFIDEDKDAITHIEHNLIRFGATHFTVVCQDTKHFLQQNSLNFDLIFLDPPFHSTELIDALHILQKKNFTGTLYIETCQALESLGFEFEILKATRVGQVFAGLTRFKK